MIKKLAFYILTILFIIGCGSGIKKELSKNIEFANHIAGYTFGNISKKSDIIVRLVEPVDTSKFNKNKDDLLAFSPSIKGKTYLKDAHTIQFIPDNLLNSDQEYIANIQLDKLVDIKKNLSIFSFKFKTLKQDYYYELEGLNTLSDKSNTQYLEGIVYFNDLVDTNEIQNLITSNQTGNNLPVVWEQQDEKTYKFVIKNIKRKDKEEKITLNFNSESINAKEDKKESIVVPKIGHFEIDDVRVIQFPDQYINIHFTDLIDDKQNFAGKIELKNYTRYISNYSIDGQNLKVFLSGRLTGDDRIEIASTIVSTRGTKLKNEHISDLSFEALKPNIRFIDDGNIIPTTDGAKLPFEAVNLKAIDVILTKIHSNNVNQFFQINQIDGNREILRVGNQILKKTIRLDQNSSANNLNQWNRYALDLSKIVNKDKGAIYQVTLNFKKEYSALACNSESNTNNLLASNTKEEDNKWTESNWSSHNYYDYYDDYYDYYDDYYDYDYSQRDNPCHSMYYRNKSIKKNILVSDIGLIAKIGGEKKVFAYTTNLKTAQPMSGVKLEFYSFDQQLLGKVNSDGQGMASIELTEKPFLLVASNEEHKSYLVLRDALSMSMSKFDTDGNTVDQGIKGFIYGERGVWRPGDDIHLSFMLEDELEILPKNHPVKLEFFDSRNRLVERKVSTTSLNGLYYFPLKTSTEAPTGSYRVSIKVGNRTFTKYLKIETVKPNRLKINLDFGGKFLSSSESTPISLHTEWLHGAKAPNLKTKVDMRFIRANDYFSKYKDFSFNNPENYVHSDVNTVFHEKVNEEGNAEFYLKKTIQNAPGMLYANFTTKVFEAGGNFSIDRQSIPYSPYKNYVGVKVPKGTLYGNTLVTDANHEFTIQSVNEKGEKAASRKVSVQVYKVRWRWWYDNYGDGYNYITKNNNNKLLDTVIQTNAKGKATFNFRVNQPDWGRYYVMVNDKQSNHTAGKFFYVDWPYWARKNRKETENASMLALSTDKEVYDIDQKVKVSFPSFAGEKTLVTVENGTSVLKQFWIDTEEQETKFDFVTTKEMTPNVYVHLTSIKPHSNLKNEKVIRQSGIVPIRVENKNTHLSPEIKAPEVVRPETTMEVTVSEKDDKSMTYTLAVVDEGLLDLTNYTTPNPWNYFYAREALGVKTWDLYNDVIGGYAIDLKNILAVGGGGATKSGKKPVKANRFKPMVRFIGPFELSGGSKTHKIDIPNYVGSVKVMIVAGEDMSYGSADKVVKVRSPLMILGTLPRVMGPQEEIALPVSVFAQEKHVKKVHLSVESNDLVSVVGEKNKTINFDKPGEKLVKFNLKVNNKIGIGKIKLQATSGNEKAKHSFEVDVRVPNPEITDVYEHGLEANNSWTPEFNFKGVEGTNALTVEVSKIPPINLGKRLRYLIQYPHGCIEQTTSSVFPQLFLSSVTDLSNDSKSEIEENIKKGIERLKLFQLYSGGFSYWPGNDEENEWGTCYATHFLLEAEEKGYKLPGNMKNNMLSYIRNKARNWRFKESNSGYYNDDNTQAYRLFLLALARKEHKSSMNRMRDYASKLTTTALYKLASSYYLIGNEDIANELLAKRGVTIPVKYQYRSYGSNIRDKAILLETYSITKQKTKALPLLNEIAKALSDNNNWMSTQTTAYSLVAISEFMTRNHTAKKISFDYTVNGKTKSVSSSKPLISIDINEQITPKLLIENKSEGLLYTRVIASGKPATGETASGNSNIKMTVNYKSLEGNPIDVTKIPQGTDFIADITVSNVSSTYYLNELAITQIFPSGWEIHNPRLDTYNSSSNQVEYQDIRDDRIYTYFDLYGRNKTIQFRVQLNATYQGKYYLPTLSAEAMYDNNIYARIPGQWVEVIAQ